MNITEAGSFFQFWLWENQKKRVPDHKLILTFFFFLFLSLLQIYIYIACETQKIIKNFVGVPNMAQRDRI